MQELMVRKDSISSLLNISMLFEYQSEGSEVNGRAQQTVIFVDLPDYGTVAVQRG
jgi:hypothetical protein